MRRIVPLIMLALPALALLAPAAFAATPTYVEAKTLADHDEASLTKAQSHALVESQGAAIDRVVPRCARTRGVMGIPPFVVVVQLDAGGKVVATWRLGDSAFATCFERELGTLSLFAPPRAPFYTSFEMSMAPRD